MITELNSKVQGSQQVQELNDKIKEIDEKWRESQNHVLLLLGENNDLKTKINKLNQDINLKEEQSIQAKEKERTLIQSLEQHRLKLE